MKARAVKGFTQLVIFEICFKLHLLYKTFKCNLIINSNWKMKWFPSKVWITNFVAKAVMLFSTCICWDSWLSGHFVTTSHLSYSQFRMYGDHVTLWLHNFIFSFRCFAIFVQNITKRNERNLIQSDCNWGVCKLHLFK